MKYTSGRLAVEEPLAYPDSASRSEEIERLRQAIVKVVRSEEWVYCWLEAGNMG